MKPVEIVVAVDKYGGFGKDGKIPWDFPADLKHFREVTFGGVCIMGRLTHADMVEMAHERRLKALAAKQPEEERDPNLPRPRIKTILKNRKSIVLSSKEDFEPEGATRAAGLREAIENLPRDDKRTIFVIGGEKVYNSALVWANKIHMTVIDEDYDCDRHFNLDYLMKNFQIREGRKVDELMFVTYHRIARQRGR